MLRSHNVQVITQYVQCTTFTFVSDVNLHNGKVLYDKMYPNSSKDRKSTQCVLMMCLTSNILMGTICSTLFKHYFNIICGF